MGKLNIAEAVIFSNRADVRNAVRQELKNNEIKPEKMHNVQTAPQCLTKLKEVTGAFLVLDWEIGPEKVLEVLQANRGEHRVETCPTMLIAAHLDDHITSVATEYSVSQVHVGEITADQIKGIIKDLVREANNLSPIRQVLIIVEKCRKEGKLTEAVEVLEKVYEKSPDNHRVALELAEAYMQSDKWDQAEVLLDKFRDTDPPLARLRHLMARCYLKKGDQQRAIEALQGAQLISPFNVERLVELGNIFLDVERPKDAKAAFDDILAFAPDSKKAKLGKSTSMLASGELNEALQLLKASANPREIASVFNTSAILSIRQGKHETALDLYRTAAAVLGSNPKIQARLMFNMGIGYTKWGKPDEALKCFEESSKLDPSFEGAQHNLQAVKKGVKHKKPAKMAVGASTLADLGGLEESIGGEFNIEESGGSLAFSTDFDDEDFDG